MTRRTHYIPVGNLQLDGVSIDPAIYCPANGYPDPTKPETLAQYCPVGGYEKIIPEYVPDDGIPMIEAPSGSITLLCINIGIPLNITTLQRNTGGFAYEVYGEGDVLLTSGSSTGGNFNFSFSNLTGGYGGNRFFKVILLPLVGYFTQCIASSVSTQQPIVEVYLNTPQLLNFDFDSSQLLKKFWTCEVMDNLVIGLNSKPLQNTISLIDVIMPKSAASQTSIESWFKNSWAPKIVFPEYMPSLKNVRYACQDCKAKEVHLPLIADVTNRMDYTFYNMPNIKKIIFSENFFGPNKKARFFNTFNNSLNFEKIELHSSHLLLDCYDLFGGLFKLQSQNNDGIFELKFDSSVNGFYGVMRGVLSAKKLTFIGDCSNASTNESGAVSGMPHLEEFIYPSKIPKVFLNLLSGLPSLKKVVLPDEIINLPASTEIYYLFSQSSVPNVEEVSTLSSWGENNLRLNTLYATKLKSFNQPTLKLEMMLVAGTSSAPRSLEYLEIDWEASVASGASSLTSGLNLSYNKLSAEELNRIFTRLPVAAGAYSITIWGNPGAATCDRSIATAKGWTVTG